MKKKIYETDITEIDGIPYIGIEETTQELDKQGNIISIGIPHRILLSPKDTCQIKNKEVQRVFKETFTQKAKDAYNAKLESEKPSQVEVIEQAKNEYINALDTFVQEQINAYNEAKQTVFTDVKSCALYATQPKQRPHKTFCAWIWEWKDDIFDYAGSELIKIQNGQREMPTSKEALLQEILEKYPSRTQEFIGG